MVDCLSPLNVCSPEVIFLLFSDMTKILELDPSNDQARRTIIRLKPLADEKREKMKEEMIGKLKSNFFCMWF